MARCDNKHPDLPVACIAPDQFPNHEDHFANFEGEEVIWPNHNFVRHVPGVKPDPDRRVYVQTKLRDVATEVRRSEPEPVEQKNEGMAPVPDITPINVE